MRIFQYIVTPFCLYCVYSGQTWAENLLKFYSYLILPVSIIITLVVLLVMFLARDGANAEIKAKWRKTLTSKWRTSVNYFYRVLAVGLIAALVMNGWFLAATIWFVSLLVSIIIWEIMKGVVKET